MEHKWLDSFVTIVEQGSLKAAAARLNVSLSELTEHLSTLEKQLNIQVFENNQLVLTPAGADLFAEAKEILALLNYSFSQMRQTELSIAMMDSHVLPQLLRVKRKMAEETTLQSIHFVQEKQQTILELLDQQLIDFGLITGSFDQEKFDSYLFPTTDRWGVLLPKAGHPNVLSVAELREKPLLVPKKDQLSPELHQEIADRLEDFRIAAVYESLVDALYLIDAEMGYGVVNDYLIGEGYQFIPFNPPVEANVYLVWKKENPLPHYSRMFLAELRMLELKNQLSS
ncbi:LysR family transcriptional regulator [Enterococcus sp. 669A]|uniref:LysR family transcriptional regulator n=1 Tax=Candidatus Enterococcus moelleringii TaxID=2815325 RepID=A0ABS3LGC5_9ENTE|nr:LysR family transcriptional regulator [Enterococcus sp. 669A]MBO1307414.1 LysR family transcriptional regulator [Enterococcus sp. 669A]